MRIGIDCRLWNETGVGRYIRNLIRELAKIDTTNQYVLFFRKREFDSLTLPGDNFTKVLADFQWHSISEQLLFPSVLYQSHVDLMHFPYFSIPFFYKKPFVITIHDLILHHFSTGEASTLPRWLYELKLRTYKFIMQYSATHAKKILTVSESTKQEIIQLLGVSESKIVVSLEGLDAQIAEGQTPSQTILDYTKEKYFLYVGNAYPHKNLQTLLRAFRDFQKENTSINLVLVGREDFFYKRIKRVVTGMGLEHVMFTGFVSDSDLAYLYTHAVATVIPSLMEGFGLPALEAMAHNSPVIASNIPSLREVCGESAWYCHLKSIEDMRKTLLSVVAASKQSILQKKKIAQKRLSLFSWEKLAKETKTTYESCTGLR